MGMDNGFVRVLSGALRMIARESVTGHHLVAASYRRAHRKGILNQVSTMIERHGRGSAIKLNHELLA
jgi:hypothetical protein